MKQENYYMFGLTWAFSIPLASGTPSPGGAGTDPVGIEVQGLLPPSLAEHYFIEKG